MADNIAVTVGTGTTIDVAGDLISGALYQRVKLIQGPDGTNSGDVSSAAPLNVKLTDGTNAVTVKAASIAAGATDPAIVVAISPNGQNANGTASDANSAPVAWSTEGKAQVGSITETAPATDTASSGLNGRLQRVAQRLTSMIALLPAALGAGSGLKVDGSGTALPVSGTVTTNAAPTTSGGLTRSRTLIPNNTTAIVVKASAGQVYKIRATNNSSTIAYIKLYDATSATAGSGTPVDTIMIPAATSGGAGIVDSTDVGIAHTTGITYTVTTGIADNDTGAPAATTYVVTVLYK